MHKKESSIPAFIASAAFLFLCGLTMILNSILIPFIQRTHQINYTLSNLIPFTFYFSYFIGAFFAGYFFNQDSYPKGIKIGMSMAIAGNLIMIWNGNTPSFVLVITAIIFLGISVAVIEVCGNPFLVSLGNKKHMSQILILGHASTAFGMIFAPFLGSKLVFSGNFSSIYLGMAFLWTLLLLTMNFIKCNAKAKASNHTKSISHYAATFNNNYVLLGLMGICACVGVEASTASFMVSFFSFESFLNIDYMVAGTFSTFFWVMLTIGRLISPLLLKFIKEESLLLFHCFLGIILSLMAILLSGHAANMALLGIGYAISIFFPLIYSLTLQKSTPTDQPYVSSILCMGNIGGALLPLFQGVLADFYQIKISFSAITLAFSFLLFYTAHIQPFKKKNPLS